MKVCSVDGCSRRHYGRSLCKSHYDKARRAGEDLPPRRQVPQGCSVDGCGRDYYGRGMCSLHYSRLVKGRDLHAPPNRKRGRRRGATLVRDENGNKHCPKCDNWVPESEFFKGCANTQDGLYSWCKTCTRDGDLRRMYGISLAEYEDMLSAQGGGCAVCGNTTEQNGRALVVDHDHGCCPHKYTCGRCVRGLLCDYCNHALGRVKDDVSTLRSLIDYLERTSIKAVAS